MVISEEFINEALSRIKPGEVLVIYVDDQSSLDIEDVVSIRINVNDDEYSILRLIAAAKAHNDPVLMSKWIITDELINRKYSRAGSLALLSRIIDYILIESGYDGYVARSFNEQEFRRVLINGSQDLKLRALEALGLDVPFSFRMANRTDDIDNVIRGLSGEFVSKYLDLRSYLLNNTALEYLLNYLDLLFRNA
ncbi:hypothetical protein [Caldivirga maquilingensis]|uniref:Uncharacterized protein n=1 Tax=Caldivirga maquilingensis (strain ATCC 700844 / DSM 13496 / JCM 10307 / IC-167) TaxID=397948 RepID=A8MAC0_CALMQ|nr:hypothetical protein [Caldivirga maquilingensis]ABW02497.1 hypothetical protein Cmaq_1674 [Caldivirga maquilingensis IC-167]